MRLEDHRYLLQRGIAGTLADTIDGHLYLTRTIEYTSYGVGRGHTQVVVAVGRKDSATSGKSIDMLV